MANNAGSGLFGGAFAILFGIVWIFMTTMIPSFIGVLFSLFGILIIGVGAYNIYMALKGGNPSAVDSDVPPRDVPVAPSPPESDGVSSGYCPWCGSVIDQDGLYCRVCGRKL